MSRLMVKLATRAWKKNIDVIDRHPEYRKRLEDAGVIDYKREVDGLEKGSDAIVKRHGFRVEQLQPTKEEPRPETVKTIQLFMSRGVRDKGAIEYAQRVGERAEDGYGFLFDPENKVVFRGDMARNPSKKLLFAAAREEKRNPSQYRYRAAIDQHKESMKDESYRRAANALSFRHEIDEGRDRGLVLEGWSKMGHSSPRVIERESAILSGMPIKLRQHLKQMRSGKDSEEDFMSKIHSQFQYGKSGKDRKLF